MNPSRANQRHNFVITGNITSLKFLRRLNHRLWRGWKGSQCERCQGPCWGRWCHAKGPASHRRADHEVKHRAHQVPGKLVWHCERASLFLLGVAGDDYCDGVLLHRPLHRLLNRLYAFSIWQCPYSEAENCVGRRHWVLFWVFIIAVLKLAEQGCFGNFQHASFHIAIYGGCVLEKLPIPNENEYLNPHYRLISFIFHFFLKFLPSFFVLWDSVSQPPRRDPVPERGGHFTGTWNVSKTCKFTKF